MTAKLGCSSDATYSRMTSIGGSTQFHKNSFRSFAYGGPITPSLIPSWHTVSGGSSYGYMDAND
jgi:hypothetical protein